MNPIWKIIFGLVLTLFVTVPAHATILYVNKDNSCPGTGTTSNPYCSIQNAFNAVAAGDSIRIRGAGTPYDEAAVLTRSGTSGNQIVIEPDTGINTHNSLYWEAGRRQGRLNFGMRAMLRCKISLSMEPGFIRPPMVSMFMRQRLI